MARPDRERRKNLFGETSRGTDSVPASARSTYYGIIVNVFRPRLCHLVKFQSSRPIVAVAQTVAITGQLSHLRPRGGGCTYSLPFIRHRLGPPHHRLAQTSLILHYFRHPTRVTRNTIETEGNRRRTAKRRLAVRVVSRLPPKLENRLSLLCFPSYQSSVFLSPFRNVSARFTHFLVLALCRIPSLR